MNVHPLFSLEGKRALITGGTRGIGLAIARLYGQAGARLVISSENQEDCQRVAAELSEEGFDACAFAADLADRQQVLALARHAGAVDVLVCNAGVAPHFGPLHSIDEPQWRTTLGVNLESALWLSAALLPGMAERGGGSVVLMASIAGVRGNKALGAYGLTKAALAQLARNLAVEWGPAGIRVNAISPGVIETAFARPMTDNPDIIQRRLALTPLRRVGTADEVAALALLLATPGGAFISGQNLIVDGGTTIGDGN